MTVQRHQRAFIWSKGLKHTYLSSVGVVGIVTVGFDRSAVLESDLSDEAEPVLALGTLSPESPRVWLGFVSTGLALTLKEQLLFSPEPLCFFGDFPGVLPRSGTTGFDFLARESDLK